MIPKEIAIEKEEVEKTFAVDPDTNAPWPALFLAVFRHDRVHALHMTWAQGSSSGSSRDHLLGRFTRSTTRP